MGIENNYKHHKELAEGRWFELSLAEQMVNIGGEVYRSINWYRKGNEKYFQNAFERALELFDLTLADKRWNGRKKEIARCREVFCQLLTDNKDIQNLEKEFDSMNKYFHLFAILVRTSNTK